MTGMLALVAALTMSAGTAKIHSASSPPSAPGPALQSLSTYLNARPLEVADAAGIIIDYPIDGTIFPPDLAPPRFLWRDGSDGATTWQVEVVFREHARPIKTWSGGEELQVGDLDLSLVGFVPPTLTPQQQADHTWTPDARTWSEIKKRSVAHSANLIITGYAGKDRTKPISRGQIAIETSRDAVGAPIFYRDVPLLPPPADQGERGVIKPLPDSVLPKIKWRLRNVSDTQSKTVMEGLPTCANCHSISRDGKTLGIDVDGPQNDKGLYAMIPIRKVSSIANDYVIHWSSFTDEGSPKRFGFMSQISPDGRYVITSIEVPHTKGPRVTDRLYNGFYSNYGFGQVFFPTRGVLAWYSRETSKLEPLPGADDPNYVQTGAFWSPDGKYLVFSRAVARDPYTAGQKRSEYANDPNETQIQYDLYRVPFNDGRGGKAEPVVGASANGMSNNFPKVSPDGKWIVFVQNKNGLLMRPDSRLFIVPFEGGEARPLRSNQPVMNSWHSFSPNGRWLVFSSKSPSLYTEMYLTHIDEAGNASPAVLIDNATAANRAVNIPEFMNIPQDGLQKIDAPATEFYRLFDAAVQLADKKQFGAAVPAWQKALQMAPDDSRAHNNLGVALVETGQTATAIAEYRKSLSFNDSSSQTHNNLGSALAEGGDLDQAIPQFQKALELNPDNAAAHVNLGNALAAKGGHLDEALSQLRKGVEMQSSSADGQNGLGVALARHGDLDEAITHLEQAVTLAPNDTGYRANLGRVLAAKGRFEEAVLQYEESARLSSNREPAVLEMLAAMYSEVGRLADAEQTAQKALSLATLQGNSDLAATLQASLYRYKAMASTGPKPQQGSQP